ncbi:hypothetical protein [Stakelama tenebrarum]|uniref:Uncharacterized protein n=1 Tax=Stakelama tenebrarum TaxID=2711215 RepID=A0A6G6Y8P2_9SPHN|nr:hypothetical protein [Sphingosinithalassobacter tenebrarum]QIG81280.1 hypothetical protein G5C33_16830 [Sphingosinithalassobacter tenebrarum]
MTANRAGVGFHGASFRKSLPWAEIESIALGRLPHRFNKGPYALHFRMRGGETFRVGAVEHGEAVQARLAQLDRLAGRQVVEGDGETLPTRTIKVKLPW